MEGLNADAYLESLVKGLIEFEILQNVVFLCTDGAAVV